MIEGTYTEVDTLFTFSGIQYKPKHFFNHGKKTGFTKELLDFSNDSAGKWGSSGLLLTAYIDTCWKGMTDAQKNMIYPKVGLIWYSLDGSTDGSIPEWIDTSAGYRPVVKQISPTKVILLNDESLSYYFTEYTESEEIPGTVLETDIMNDMTIHIICPHCGKKIF
ncbi:MAG: hypothetical protein WC554_00345 [Clostridia bacterium]